MYPADRYKCRNGCPK